MRLPAAPHEPFPPHIKERVDAKPRPARPSARLSPLASSRPLPAVCTFPRERDRSGSVPSPSCGLAKCLTLVRPMKKRIAVIGAGLCGSLLSALLRDRFEVTLIEQGRRKRPLFTDVNCTEGEVNTSINRAEGLGGTTNYWHNALIELTEADLRKAGVKAATLAPYYAKAWRFFLSEEEIQECVRVREGNRGSVESEACSVAHMVLPQARHNMWELANQRYPGGEIRVVYGQAKRIVPAKGSESGYVEIAGANGVERIEADTFLVCAGGLATPVVLSASLGEESAFCAGYHDHPMAYVAKVHLKSDSRLKAVSCTTTASAEVRAGLVYETDGMKTVIYLRPAMNMSLKSITGAARYILSDLRNDPFSPKKIFQLLTNLEAVREAILFKTRSGFLGDYYSVLILGEQTPIDSRGLTLKPDAAPSLNWHVTEAERASYATSFESFMREFSGDIVERHVIPSADWEFRTAAHHSGASNRFLDDPGDISLEFYAAKGIPNTFVCDGSLLRAAGIANSGLTLVALGHRLAELLSQRAG